MRDNFCGLFPLRRSRGLRVGAPANVPRSDSVFENVARPQKHRPAARTPLPRPNPLSLKSMLQETAGEAKRATTWHSIRCTLSGSPPDGPEETGRCSSCLRA